MSEFARKVLEKYGWSEGKGLGRLEDGIKQPLQVSVKLNTYGVGHDSSKELTSRWWCQAFNNAADCIKVENSEDGVQIVSLKRKRKPDLVTPHNVRKDFVKGGALIDCIETQEESPIEEFQTESDADEIYKQCEAKQNYLSSSAMKGKLKRIHNQDESFAQEQGEEFSSKKHKNELTIENIRKKKLRNKTSVKSSHLNKIQCKTKKKCINKSSI